MNPNITPPKPKDYLNLELWAIRNNLYAHPTYLKALKTKEEIAIVSTATIMSIFLVVIEIIKIYK